MKKQKTQQSNMSTCQIVLIWMGAGICLASIYAGNTLAGLGMRKGIAAIIVGTIIGTIPMYLMSVIGTRERVSGMMSTRPALGIRGSYIASVINIIQLLGWVAVMILVTQEACTELQVLGSSEMQSKILILIIGAVITVNAALGHNNWKWFQWITVGATVLLSIVMTVAVFKVYPYETLIKMDYNQTTGLAVGIDSLVGLSLAWVPLVPDYSRYAEKEKKAAIGTFLAYAGTSMWMFFVGLVCSVATESVNASPVKVMVELNLGKLGLGVVILSGVTTAFLNVFSSGVSAMNILPRAKERVLVIIAGVIGTVIALFFPINNFQGFLMLLGAVFVPLEAIVIVDYFLIRKSFKADEMDRKGGEYWYKKGIHFSAVLTFIIGFAVYEMAYYLQWKTGSSIVSVCVTGCLYYILAKLEKSRRIKKNEK